ncbi:MAG: hypothetical protein CMH83_12345 [Nocardioides sp.]|nr:hypothetical protein [Nocardioides sp.]
MNDTPHTPRTATRTTRNAAEIATFWALVEGMGRTETVESVETGANEIAALEALMDAPAAPTILPNGLVIHEPGDWNGVL